MSGNIQRFDAHAGIPGRPMDEAEDGDYVRYTDHEEAMAAMQEAYNHRTESLIVHGGVALACSQAVADAHDAAVSTLSALREENERLREALQLLATEKPVVGMNPKARIGDPIDKKIVWSSQQIARAALTPKEQGNG